ncbi:hypothetical protein [Micromonospora haikouensis]|uniref:hypothetical protein n=1 Tax=Micromonospora haikouensis TaxID=686309 RepID=UPI003D706078
MSQTQDRTVDAAGAVQGAIARQRRGGEPQQASWLAKGLVRALPNHLRDSLIREAADRAAEAKRAKAAGLPAPRTETTDEVPASDLVQRQQAEAREKALQACLPDDRMSADLGLTSLYDDQNADAIAAWLADPDKLTAIFAGTTGSGKTQAAYATAAEATRRGAATRLRSGKVITKGLLVREWTMHGYLAELRPNGSPDPVWRVRDRARTAELLIINDLAAEMEHETEARDFVRKELLELLEYRINHRYRTIFTTNLRAKDYDHGGVRSVGLETRLGARLWSRLQDRADAFVFTGPDRRTLSALNW